jgi:hypothetical protein
MLDLADAAIREAAIQVKRDLEESGWRDRRVPAIEAVELLERHALGIIEGYRWKGPPGFLRAGADRYREVDPKPS